MLLRLTVPKYPVFHHNFKYNYLHLLLHFLIMAHQFIYDAAAFRDFVFRALGGCTQIKQLIEDNMKDYTNAEKEDIKRDIVTMRVGKIQGTPCPAFCKENPEKYLLLWSLARSQFDMFYLKEQYYDPLMSQIEKEVQNNQIPEYDYLNNCNTLKTSHDHDLRVEKACFCKIHAGFVGNELYVRCLPCHAGVNAVVAGTRLENEVYCTSLPCLGFSLSRCNIFVNHKNIQNPRLILLFLY